ncbi:MAG: hypothetical protein AAGI07_00185 [Bacteroidota bacterium]
MRKVSIIIKATLLFGLLYSFSIVANAQNAVNNAPPLTLNLNPEGSHWIKFSTYTQLWARVNQNNPGSTVAGELRDFTSDVSIRRFRLGLQGQPIDNLYVLFYLGVNNLNYLSPRGTSLDLLDAHVDYTFSKQLAIGGGKSAWDGLSRYTSPSSSKQLSYDLPFVALPTLDATDDLIRKLSLYAKGKIANLDYRLVMIKPLSVQNSRSFRLEPIENIAAFTDDRVKLQYSGYVKYEFWEKESNRTPYHVGTYNGAKKVLNLGIGFNFQNDALWSLNEVDTLYHNMTLVAIDFFIDLPINRANKTALTVYTAFFSYDFGPNYIRLLGANNPTNGIDPQQVSFNGRGNTFPVSGTGYSGLFQVGYQLPPFSKGLNLGQLQPYATLQLANFKRLADPMAYFDIGMNWYLNSHSSKFSFNFQNRPIFFEQTDGIKMEERKWLLVLQYQFSI